MLKLIRPLKNPSGCRQLLNAIPLQSDISNYAKGRKRSWLYYEPHLGSKPSIQPAFFSHQLDHALKAIDLPFDLGLLSLHSVSLKSDARIKPHRDTSFAQPKAYLINIGKATFGYNPNRHCTLIDKIQPVDLIDGIYEFDCKHLHSVIAAENNRLGLVLWKLTPKYKVLT
jgi:hypothetical protein